MVDVQYAEQQQTSTSTMTTKQMKYAQYYVADVIED